MLHLTCRATSEVSNRRRLEQLAFHLNGWRDISSGSRSPSVSPVNAVPQTYHDRYPENRFRSSSAESGDEITWPTISTSSDTLYSGQNTVVHTPALRTDVQSATFSNDSNTLSTPAIAKIANTVKWTLMCKCPTSDTSKIDSITNDVIQSYLNNVNI
jgi:hypothetical protein